MADKVINVDIRTNTTGVKSLKAELRETVQLLQQTQDPKQFEALSLKAAELKDRMAEVNESVNALATGSKYEKVTKAFGEMGAGLRDMDFDRVVSGSKLFAKAAGAITFKDAIGSVKQMGSALLSVGKAIMTNPLFLIAGVIALIVAGVIALMDKLGILKKVFDTIGWVIDEVIQAIKDFLDLIGLTTYAAEDAAQRQVNALQKIADQQDKNNAKIEDSFDHQIKLAQIEGKNTVEMEKEKQQAIMRTQQTKYDALKAALEIGKAQGILDAEQIKALKDQALAAKNAIHESRQEMEIINAQEVADNKKKNGEIEKSNEASYKERLAKQKQYNADRLAAERFARDLEISLLEDGVVKDIVTINEKYMRIYEDVAKNEKLLVDEKKRLLELYAQEEAQTRQDLVAKYATPEEGDSLSILPPPEEMQSEADQMVEIISESFSNIDKLRMSFREDFMGSFSAIGDSATALFQGVASLAEAFAGKSEASAKKAFNIAKAANIAQATMDTIKGAVGAFTQSVSTLPAPLGAIVGALSAAATVAMGVANIKKISSQQFGSGGGSVSANTGGGAATSIQPSMQPSIGLYGNANQGNNVSSSNTGIMNNITVKAVVSESEVTGTQAKVNKMKEAGVL